MDAVSGSSLSALDVEMLCDALVGAEAAGSQVTCLTGGKTVERREDGERIQ